MNLSNSAINQCTPEYSASGKLIAFSQGADCNSAGSSAIFVMNADGSNQHQVTAPPSGYLDAQPNFSPDGKQLIFERDQVGGFDEQLYVANADGTGVHQLVTAPGGFADETPRFSPDGKKIAFMREPANDSSGQIMIMNANGTGVATPLSNPPAGLKDSGPSFSPDGSKIVFNRGDAIDSGAPTNVIVVDVNTHAETALTFDTTGGFENEDPAFSPDGKLIAYGRLDAGTGAQQLFLMNSDGSGKHAITPADINQADYEPSWQTLPPFGTRITGAKVKKSRHKATFRFTATGATGFECALVKPRKGKHHKKSAKPKFKTCKSPKTYKHLTHGKYTFEVRGVNAAGPDPSPATRKLRL
jgi:TolB protein